MELKGKRLKYDTILSEIGEFGVYQRWSVFLLSLACVPFGIHGTRLVFLLVDPPYRCAVPGLSNDTFHVLNEVHRSLLNVSIPFDDSLSRYLHCDVFASINSPNGSDTIGTRTTACHAWVYDPNHTPSSMVDDMDIVCENKDLKVHFSSAVMLGLLFGSLLGGPLADYFGRKTVILTCLLTEVVLGTATAFVHEPMPFLLLLFPTHFVNMAGFVVAFVLIAEIVGPSKRTLAVMGTMIGWVLGLFTLALVDFLIQEWRISQVVFSLPSIAFISMYWLLDESPRWLLVKQRPREAIRIIRRIAKVNRSTPPENLSMLTGLATDEKKVKAVKVWQMCSSKILLVRLTILTLGWCACTMVYYGLTLNVGTLIDGDVHVNFSILAVMEFISHILCVLFLEKINRKKIYCTSLLLAGISCLATAGTIFAQLNSKWAGITLFAMGKFGITFSFSLVYIITSEVLPTEVRNSGMGFCSCIGRLSGVLSPYVALLGDMISPHYGKTLPLIMFGAFSVVAGLATMILPETRNRKLPETIDDARHFERTEDIEKSLEEYV